METIIWNDTTEEFDLVHMDTARAMIGIGSEKGFNRATCNFAQFEYITMVQKGSKCYIYLIANKKVLHRASGRVEAKKVAMRIAKLSGAKLRNQKKNGELVDVPV